MGSELDIDDVCKYNPLATQELAELRKENDLCLDLHEFCRKFFRYSGVDKIRSEQALLQVRSSMDDITDHLNYKG